MSKLDQVVEMFETNPSLADWGNGKISEAFKIANGQDVSSETVRQAKIKFADLHAAAVEDEPSMGTGNVNDDDEESLQFADEGDPEPETVDEDAGDKTETAEHLHGFTEQDIADLTAYESETPEPTDFAQKVADATGEPYAGAEPKADETPEPEAPKADEPEEPVAEEPASTITREPVEGRCNHRMERAKDLCGRPLGHPGGHVTYAQMKKKKDFSKARAKVRYHSDPAYAERIKAASRTSHKKARDAAKAAKEAAEAAKSETSEVEGGTIVDGVAEGAGAEVETASA